MRVVIGGSCRSASFRVVGLAFVALVAPSALAVVVLGVLAGVLCGVLAWRDNVDQLADLVGKRFDGFLHVCRVRFGGLLLVVSSAGESSGFLRGDALWKTIEKRFCSLEDMLRSPTLIDVSSHLDGDFRVNSAYC